MKVSLTVPERQVFSGMADSVSVVGEKGQLTLLDRHADIITLVKPGKVLVRSGSDIKSFVVGDGVLKVDGDSLLILAKSVTHGEV